MLIVTADDFGSKQIVTDNIIDCYIKNRITAASAMVFMNDSERAADLALEHNLNVGLHLNFTQELTGKTTNFLVRMHHKKVSTYLKRYKFNQILYNPFLINSFEYIFKSQWEEFSILYHHEPIRIDGHHHMHLCMNMLIGSVLPEKIRVRKHFDFTFGEKSLLKILYRQFVDRWLQSRQICTDYFFSLVPIKRSRLKRIISLSKCKDVEIMVHPGINEEYLYLTSNEWVKLLEPVS